MMRRSPAFRRLLTTLFCLLLPATVAPAADVLRVDFEDADATGARRIEANRAQAAIVEPGANGSGHCLRLHNDVPSTECGLTIKGPIAMQKNLTLSFDHREEVESGFEGAYLGVIVRVDGKQWAWTSDTFSGDWRHVDIELARLAPREGQPRLQVGTVFSEMHLYARVKEQTKVREATKARLTAWFDNVRLHTDPLPPKGPTTARESYANPPLFNWPAPLVEGQRQRLQFSQDPAFPEAASQTVDVPWNFYTPPAALQPGTWYWRSSVPSELSDGWSPPQAVTVLPEAHRFMTAPIPVQKLAATPRPRLRALAQVDQAEVTAARKAELVKLAKKIYDRGVPEHPGPHVPGDPRWPTWIDWYGKVAGSITGGTGRRLQSIGQYAMLSGDPQVIAWTKALALEACRWDPEGGSAMKLGDIGAQHLLRGLCWCYDATADSMTPDERGRLRAIIVQRAGQFWRQLNPFHGSEANNHAWLQALALGEAGIVLAGDHPEAAAWAEYARQLYIGRFLCCMGYQGENNEGMEYWGYGLGFVIDYGDLLRATCGIDLFQHPWLNQTARFPMYCAPPNAWAVSFADTAKPNHSVRGPAETKQVGALALRTRDPYALWYAGQTAPVDGLTPRQPSDLPQSIFYPHIGVAIFNTSLVDGREGVTVAMHSGRYWAGHQHADQNHFVINAYGQKLAIDGGYYDWYGSPHFKAYSAATLAHNTLLVDGQGQAMQTAGADGRMSHYFDAPGYGYMVGDASKPEVYQGRLKRFDRRVLFIKPGFVLVQDLVSSSGDAARQYDWLLHAIVPIESEAAAGTFVIPCQTAALRGRFFGAELPRLEVKTGFPVEPVDGYSTRPVPKDKYSPEWTLYATPPMPRPQAQFLVAMQVQRRGGERADPPAEMIGTPIAAGYAIGLRCAGRAHTVLFRDPAASGPLEFEGLRTDGSVAAVETDEQGRVIRAMAIEATSLTRAGAVLFHTDRATDSATPTTP